jgi:hypothetical protein
LRIQRRAERGREGGLVEAPRNLFCNLSHDSRLSFLRESRGSRSANGQAHAELQRSDEATHYLASLRRCIAQPTCRRVVSDSCQVLATSRADGNSGIRHRNFQHRQQISLLRCEVASTLGGGYDLDAQLDGPTQLSRRRPLCQPWAYLLSLCRKWRIKDGRKKQSEPLSHCRVQAFAWDGFSGPDFNILPPSWIT